MFHASSKGSLIKSFKKLENYEKVYRNPLFFQKYADMGLKALQENTPKDSGLTKESWSYNIVQENGKTKIIFNNNNIIKTKGNEVPLVILLQYGHATISGKWVEGNDFINPALKPVFETLLLDIEKELAK